MWNAIIHREASFFFFFVFFCFFLGGPYSPTPQLSGLLSSQFVFSCGPQECSSHTNGKPTTNNFFFPCKRFQLSSAREPPLDGHNRKRRALTLRGSSNRSLTDRWLCFVFFPHFSWLTSLYWNDGLWLYRCFVLFQDGHSWKDLKSLVNSRFVVMLINCSESNKSISSLIFYMQRFHDIASYFSSFWLIVFETLILWTCSD